jgi:yecA family protein
MKLCTPVFLIYLRVCSTERRHRMTRYEAFINRGWREAGNINLIVARIRPNQVEIGGFLTDCWCLGVKDALYTKDETDFEAFVEERLPDEFRERIHPACAKKLIDGAVAYAEQLGFAPHRDYRKARRVLGGIDTAVCTEEFTFGKDGKPFYVASETDSQERINRVIAILKARCGEDGFYYLIQAAADTDDEDLSHIARENLLEFFDGEPDEAPDFFEFSGMVTALHICPQIIMPTKLLERFWEPGGREWKSDKELRDFAGNLQAYWNETADWLAESADAPPDEAWPIDISDDAEDPAQYVAGLASWCRGFIRATTEWPEAWGSALTRADLAPHWEIVRAWAEPGAPASTKLIKETGERESPEMRGQTLPLAIVALYRALRHGGAK